MTAPTTRTLRGAARHPDEAAGPAVVTLEADGFSIAVGGRPPVAAGYRDLAVIAAEGATLRVQLGEGPWAETLLLERFGQLATALERGLRDGRLRQRLTDGLVRFDADGEIDLVEYAAGAETGVAQLCYHDRGAVLAPVDESRPWRRIRRADIGAVTLDTSVGGVAVHGAGRSLPPAADGGPAIRLLRLGALAKAHHDRWAALRDGAAADAAATVAGLVPDAPYGLRRFASSLLLEGHPLDPAALGEAWAPLETAVLGHPPFDESYRVLRTIGGGDGAPRWLATAPESPGAASDPRLWFLVGLPGNLLALELVSGGAHATYVFRVVSRATWTGAVPDGALEAAVADVSEALIDARFLREPIALPAARLAEPGALRYRLALTALPSLAAARARFVARVIHRDAASWEGALRDLVAWHATARDDPDEWPGRGAQEAAADADPDAAG